MACLKWVRVKGASRLSTMEDLQINFVSSLENSQVVSSLFFNVNF